MANSPAPPAADTASSAPRLPEWEDFTGNYKNYGSVDLDLRPDWSRDEAAPTLLSSSIIGHENGKADAFRATDPKAKHQFSWCDATDKSGEAMRRMQGYALVTRGEWVKNPLLWEWAADEKSPGVQYCVNYEGRLWARPEARFIADRDRRASTSVEQIIGADLAKHPGAAAAVDQQGRPLVATTR